MRPRCTAIPAMPASSATTPPPPFGTRAFIGRGKAAISCSQRRKTPRWGHAAMMAWPHPSPMRIGCPFCVGGLFILKICRACLGARGAIGRGGRDFYCQPLQRLPAALTAIWQKTHHRSSIVARHRAASCLRTKNGRRLAGAWWGSLSSMPTRQPSQNHPAARAAALSGSSRIEPKDQRYPASGTPQRVALGMYPQRCTCP
jgi:hypothetical protein